MFCFDPEFWFKNVYIQSFLERKQQNGSFRSWKIVDLTLLAATCRRPCFYMLASLPVHAGIPTAACWRPHCCMLASLQYCGYHSCWGWRLFFCTHPCYFYSSSLLLLTNLLLLALLLLLSMCLSLLQLSFSCWRLCYQLLWLLWLNISTSLENLPEGFTDKCS